MKKIRNILFSLIFLAGFLGTIIYTIFVKEQLAVSIQENRNLAQFSDCALSGYATGAFQKNLEDAIADQFVGRYELVSAKKELDKEISGMIVPVSDDELLLHKVEGVSNVYQVGNSNYLMNGLMMENEDYKVRFSNRVQQINEFQKRYPDIEMFVYKPTQIHETSLFDEKNGITSYGEKYSEILRTGLEVPYAELEINDLETYKEYFYASDHHWNYKGSYQGYLDILKLLKGEEEEPLLPIELKDFDHKLIMQGTFAGRTGYIYDGDEFFLYTFDLPEHAIITNDMEVENIINMNTFEAPEVLNDPSQDYYFYNSAYANYGPYSVWINENNVGKDNLLVVGDSYTGPVLPLLMAHYYQITFVQPFDYYLENNYNYFYYDEFISQHDVDQILFMCTVENYFYHEIGEDYEVNQYEKFDIHYQEGN